MVGLVDGGSFLVDFGNLKIVGKHGFEPGLWVWQLLTSARVPPMSCQMYLALAQIRLPAALTGELTLEA